MQQAFNETIIGVGVVITWAVFFNRNQSPHGRLIAGAIFIPFLGYGIGHTLNQLAGWL